VRGGILTARAAPSEARVDQLQLATDWTASMRPAVDGKARRLVRVEVLSLLGDALYNKVPVEVTDRSQSGCKARALPHPSKVWPG